MTGGEELFGSLYEKGHVLFRQGDPADVMYVIQSGALEVVQQRGAQEEVLAFLEKGDLVGEIALLDRDVRTATVRTITRSRLLPFTRESLLSHVRTDPHICHHILKALTAKMLRTDRRLLKRLQGAGELQLMHNDGHADPTISLPLLERLWKVEKKAVHLDAGEILFEEGDSGDCLYIVKKGLVEIIRGTGTELRPVACLGEGSFFGEMALITGETRSATARARCSTELLSLTEEGFHQRLRDVPELGLYLIVSLIRRLRQREAMLDNPKLSIESPSIREMPQHAQHSRSTVSLVSLSTCGGCATALLENDTVLHDFLQLADIRYCPMLMDQGEWEAVDICLVDGVVRVGEDVEELLRARSRARYLVALGTCSGLGGIPALANQHEIEELMETSYGETRDPVSYYLSGTTGIDQDTYQDRGLPLLRRAGRVEDFVRVDYYLPGCPPNPLLLVELLREIREGRPRKKSAPVVCAECARKPSKDGAGSFERFPESPAPHGTCLASAGFPCMGFLTRGGCTAPCPRAGVPCWGCRGPSLQTLQKMEQGESFDALLCAGLIRRSGVTREEIEKVIRFLRKQGHLPCQFGRRLSRAR